eukprot:gene40018-48756_t
MVGFEDLSDYPVSFIVRYLSQHPADFLALFTVCKRWASRFDNEDAHIWKLISSVFKVTLHVNVRSSVGLRSKSKLKQLFIKACHKRQKELQDKHDLLILQARNLLSRKSDSPKFLLKLVVATFPDMEDFNPNYRCPTVENNTLLTLSARCSHLKCMKMLIENFRADVNLAEAGGFSPLVLCAYHGSFPAVKYLVSRGADISIRGRLRSGALLTAEHWAAVRGFGDVCSYLRAVRLKGYPTSKEPDNSVHSVDSFSSGITSPPCSPGSSSLSSAGYYVPSPLAPLAQNLTEATPSSSTHFQDEKKWCLCGGAFEGGAMIACDSPQCVLEWYHFDCVGLVTPPLPDEPWICPDCNGDQFPEPPLKRKGNRGSYPAGKKKKTSKIIQSANANSNQQESSES